MDMNFVFSCSTRYLTRSLRSKLKFISTRGHELNILYIFNDILLHEPPLQTSSSSVPRSPWSYLCLSSLFDSKDRINGKRMNSQTSAKQVKAQPNKKTAWRVENMSAVKRRLKNWLTENRPLIRTRHQLKITGSMVPELLFSQDFN